MGNAYNSIYKHARAEVVAQELTVEVIARNLETFDLSNENAERVHDFIVCAEANDARPDPLVTGRLACPQECKLTDPEQIEAEAAMKEESDLDQWAEARRENHYGCEL